MSVEGSRGVLRVLVGKPDGKRALRTPVHRWNDNIKMRISSMWFVEDSRDAYRF
jgi:hypothetical protein